MILSGIAQRYAKALLQAALKANTADEVFEDTRSLTVLLEQNPKFRDFLLSPQVLIEEKQALVKRTLGDRVSKLLAELLALLIAKKRIVYVEEIANAYRHLYEKHKGIMEVKAITAVPLDEPLREKLLRKLEDQTKKTIRLVPEIDPHIIGGVVLRMEGKIIDGSIKYELEQLKRHLATVRITGTQDSTPDAGQS